MASGRTSRLALPYPLETDAPDVAADMQSLASALDVLVPPVKLGTRASRPAANTVPSGGTYYATDNGITYESDGVSVWTAITWSPITVTALPTSPTPEDGQLINMLADTANGVVWQFRYRLASSSAYKWEFVGGSPMLAQVDTQESITATSYADMTTVGPAVTLPSGLPNGGDFDVHFGADIDVPGGTNFAALMSFQVGGTAAADIDGLIVGGTSLTISAARTRRKTVASGGVALTAKYRTETVQALISNRFLSVRPVRVG